MKKEHLKNIALNKIKPYERNPRKNDKAVDYVCDSIKKNGYIAPIIVDNEFYILAGHTRFKALKKLDYKTCDIIKITGLTEKQKKDFRIMDNKSSELADWDFDALQLDFKPLELKEFGFDLQKDFGIEPEPDLKADIIPEVDKKNVICKTGDLWQLGKHRLLCGDSTKEDDVKRLMDGKKADMVFTDPPYSVNYTKKAKEVLKSKSYVEIANDNMGVKETAENLWKPYFSLCYNFSKDIASIYCTMPQGGDQMMMMMMMMIQFFIGSGMVAMNAL